ncbi:MAG: hypothetical protein QM778_26195 [Myxococcales bacterium]
MDELSPAARRALEALREDRPDDDTRGRMRQRVLAASLATTAGAGALSAGTAQAASATSVGAGAGSLGASASSFAAGGTALSAGKLLLVVASLGALGTGAMLVPTRHESSRVERTPSLTTHSTAAATPPLTTTEPEVLLPDEHALPPEFPPARAPDAALAAPSPAPLRARARSAQPIPPSQVAPASDARPHTAEPNATATQLTQASASALQAENQLLLQALRSFEADQACAALSLLERHEREFGASALLAPERQRMRARFSQRAPDSTACNEQKGSLP